MITSEFIWDSFEKYADNIFLIDSHTEYTYKSFYQLIKKISSPQQFSLSKSQKAALKIDNSLNSLVSLFAIMFNGGIPVLLSPDIPDDHISEMLDSIECNILLQPIDNSENITHTSNTSNEFISVEDATVIFSSGTSSTPKAILHTYSNHYYSALGSHENITFHKNERWVMSLPIHHIGGLSIVFRALLAGGTLVSYDKTSELVDAVDENHITHISVVSTQLDKLCTSPDKLHSLKAILVGGSMIPDDLIEKAIELNLPVYKTYGLSEMSSQVTTTSQSASSEELTTSGKILNYRELKIADDNEILVRGEVLCKKYLNAEIDIDSEGWFHTGDLGSIDSNGYLTVYGRKDNMFISGGENIYPEPIEKIILEMDSIIEACIVPKNDKKFGEVPVLFYKSSPNTKLTVEKLSEYLQSKVKKFEIPKEIYSFPKDYTDLGIKINRTFLKEFITKL